MKAMFIVLCFVLGVVIGYISVILLVSYSTFGSLTYSISPSRVYNSPWKSTPSFDDHEKKCPRVIKMVVVIFSSPDSHRRQMIRETWLNTVSGNLQVTCKFLVGTEGLDTDIQKRLQSEQTKFGDMLLFSEVKDSFKNLTSKLLLGMVWAHKNAEFDYFMKVDDDCYVRLDRAEQALRNMSCINNLHWGYFAGGSWPQLKGKYVETQWFLCERYVTYTMGAGYILSKATFSMVMKFSEKLVTKYNNDDINVALWLAPLELFRLHDLKFDFDMNNPACNSNFIVSHRHTNSSLHDFHEMIRKNELVCTEQQESLYRYTYDWKADSVVNCCYYSPNRVKYDSYSSFGRAKH